MNSTEALILHAETAPKRLPAAETLTPAMRQYVEQKQRVGDAILLFRMGDFYETFYDDAVLCSKVLGIALTSRSKETNPVPLAGIPYHALDNYLRKLVTAGHKVAISEQLEDPKLAKTVVKRDVVRIVTAGTLTEDTLLDERDENILAAFSMQQNGVGIAWVELSGGRFETIEVRRESLIDELVRLHPAEVLIESEPGGDADALAARLPELAGSVVTRRPALEFASYAAEKALLDHFRVSTLAGFGFDGNCPSLCAAGAILQYLSETQKTALSHISAIHKRQAEETLQMDQATFRSLEIERTLRTGSRKGSLLDTIDRTVHSAGARTLKRWLTAPLVDPIAISQRLDAVAWLVADDSLRTDIRTELRRMADVERIASRIALLRAGPRDLAGLGQTLDRLPTLLRRIPDGSPKWIETIGQALTGFDDLADLLRRAIRPDPPMGLREGGFFADGFDAELDRLRTIANDGAGWLAEFQRREIERTGLSSLKVGYNRVFGYYLELPHRDGERVPPEYVRRQTVKNAERYVTDELKKYESEVLGARERANDLEYRLFERIREQTASRLPRILAAADAIGRLDGAAALAVLAVERRYVRPELTDDGRLEIEDGRHPVLDQALLDGFVPNDTLMTLQDGRVFVITGPNMAGKSTYIRQVALLTLLAQAGSFVPAKRMVWEPVDRLFARVGSTDEIMRGQSTFMVEMTEAANVLHYATSRSLVILDELGRGTSTFDGLSLAWAVTERIAVTTNCRALIATHYHELTELASLLKGVRNFNVAIREITLSDRAEESIVFLHRIVEGAADKSYGLHVARLAGIPVPVIQRAREILAELEKGFSRESRSPRLTRAKTRNDQQIALFRDPGDELLDELRTLDPNAITPLDAIHRLAEWKKRFA